MWFCIYVCIHDGISTGRRFLVLASSLCCHCRLIDAAVQPVRLTRLGKCLATLYSGLWCCNVALGNGESAKSMLAIRFGVVGTHFAFNSMRYRAGARLFISSDRLDYR